MDLLGVDLLLDWILLDGTLGVVGSFRSDEKSDAPLAAIIGLVVGTALLFWTGFSVRLFLVLVGVWAMIQGGGMFLSCRYRESNREAGSLVGIVGGALAVAGLILIVWPDSGVVTVSWLIAIIALLLGCLLIFVGNRLRRIASRIRQPG